MPKKAEVKCPFCSGVQKIEIPEDKCLAFYKCDSCGKLVFAKNSCCVICDYSDQKCPVSMKK